MLVQHLISQCIFTMQLKYNMAEQFVHDRKQLWSVYASGGHHLGLCEAIRFDQANLGQRKNSLDDPSIVGPNRL